MLPPKEMGFFCTVFAEICEIGKMTMDFSAEIQYNKSRFAVGSC
jgi:hypothetical protein